MIITVVDDGQGFDASDLTGFQGVGLAGMRQAALARAESLGIDANGTQTCELANARLL